MTQGTDDDRPTFDMDQLLYDAEQGWALSTEARMALAAEVRRLRALLDDAAPCDPWGGVVVSGDQLDLDAIEMRAARADNLGSAIYTLELDVPALVAEVRRLREEREEVSDMLGYLDLHIGRYQWKVLTTEQKELFADLVDESGWRGEDRPPRLVERWWRE